MPLPRAALAAFALALAYPAAAKRPAAAFFQLGGILWIRDYTPHTINGYRCVASGGVDFCGPSLMESGEEDFLAWARFVRRPEKFFKSLDMYLGDNVLAAVVFEERLKAPELVFYWKDGLERNLYLRLPWPYTVNRLGGWIKGEGRKQWAYMVEYHDQTVFDPSKRRWNVGQFTHDSLAKGGAHSRGETKIVYAAVAAPAPPRESDRLTLAKPAFGRLLDVLRGESRALDGVIVKEGEKGGAESEERIRRAAEELGRLQDQVKTLSGDPDSYCPECGDD